MRPAFSSTRQAAAFALMLLILLLLPVMVGKSGLPSREQVYSSIWWGYGAFPYIDNQIFTEKGDIDIAFVGSSHMWEDIDTPYVQKMLSEKLGRPAVVRTMAWTGGGYDALYFITRDLLQHRKVHMLVCYNEYNLHDLPHDRAPWWFRFGDDSDALDGLSFRLKACYYFAAVLGMPRNLLGLVRDNLPADLSSAEKNVFEVSRNAENIPSRLGSIAARRGFTLTSPIGYGPFETYLPQTGIKPSDVSVYPGPAQGAFQFESSLPPWQLGFARKYSDLAHEHGCQMVVLHLPIFEERRDPVVHERECWPQALHAEVAVVGIPSAKLFQGMTDEQVKKLYSDPLHFNKNGQDYFTALITPSLLDLYDRETRP